ncbi:MAG: hypothetical protein IPP00_04355 [Actinomycetales bacterium]|uniref:Uncharacterized protein n=1 Tax=Candidatus Phosphoribacter hodrii TaxID=2953743 RepID=A0A9D7T670_9MICO|nr:hypothetical protein [Candidatus Phosphoribacter hodrii]HPV78836.1 hypothetical protein [Dermatophilaceae bacterium]
MPPAHLERAAYLCVSLASSTRSVISVARAHRMPMVGRWQQVRAWRALSVVTNGIRYAARSLRGGRAAYFPSDRAT